MAIDTLASAKGSQESTATQQREAMIPASAVPAATSGKLRVENLHYDLTEKDLADLFEKIGPLATPPAILYDRSDRSKGIAFVTYADTRDAKDAIREYDGANAYGQPIRLIAQPSGPSGGIGNGGPRAAAAGVGYGRSLFDRIDDGRDTRRRTTRSESPAGRGRDRDSRRRGPPPAPDYVDRYVPASRARSRSPPRRQSGRRPGVRREDSDRDRERGGRGGRGGRRGGRDAEGRPVVQGRPRKTAEELDAEMTDYWGPGGNEAANGGGMSTSNGVQGQKKHGTGLSDRINGLETSMMDADVSSSVTAAVDQDIEDTDMIE